LKMSTPMEKAAAHLLKLETDRAATLAASEEKLREATLIKAREEGFREAMEIFGLTSAPPDTETETEKSLRAKRRDIRQMIIKELSFSAKAMTKQQIAKAINYAPEGTEAALKRLEREGTVQNRDGYWEAVAVPAAQPNGHAHQ
jgi:CRP-like cAMP-binding protein